MNPLVESLIWVAAGLVALCYGADWMVKGAVRLALRARIKPAVIGVTIVAFGTSAPELLTTVMAAAKGEAALAIGNIMGSNICNILLAIGLTATVKPIPSDIEVFRWDGPWVFISAGLLALFMWVGGSGAEGAPQWEIVRWEGIVLVVVFALFLISTFIRTRRAASVANDSEVGEELATLRGKPAWHDVFFFVVGLAVLVIGADRTVHGSVGVATELGIPAGVIGLTVVAFGTSLPEIATSVSSARKGESGMALANVTGSNIQNIVLCLGLAAVVVPAGFIPVDEVSATVDIAVMGGVTLLLLTLMKFTDAIGRKHGILLLSIYGAYVGLLAYRSLT